jgi:Fe-Mn family superoxide dismutase
MAMQPLPVPRSATERTPAGSTHGSKRTAISSKPLEEIVKATAGKADKAGIFNNAAQVWNHTFYWNSMKPKGGGKPTGNVAQKIDNDLGGYQKFVEQFSQAGATQFGSGDKSAAARSMVML